MQSTGPESFQHQHDSLSVHCAWDFDKYENTVTEEQSSETDLKNCEEHDQS